MKFHNLSLASAWGFLRSGSCDHNEESMTVTAVLVLWCSASLLIAPFVGRAMRTARVDRLVTDSV